MFNPTLCFSQAVSIFQLSRLLFEQGWFHTNFSDGSSRQKNRAVDGRKLRVEDSKLSPICCGLLSTFYSQKRFDWPLPMAFAFEKLIVYQKSVDFADQICLRSENFARRLATICVGPINPQAPARPSVATRRHAKASDANPRSPRGTNSRSRNATACVNLQIDAPVGSSFSEKINLRVIHDKWLAPVFRRWPG